MNNQDINKQLIKGFKELQTEYLKGYKSELESAKLDFWISDLNNLNFMLKKEIH